LAAVHLGAKCIFVLSEDSSWRVRTFLTATVFRFDNHFENGYNFRGFKKLEWACVNHLVTPQAQILRAEMGNAQAAFRKAQEDYLNALAIAMDTEVHADDAVALRNEGRAYAEALTRYSDATMAWLVFVETNTRPQVELRQPICR
jgi:hypothetical protein